MTEPPAPRRQAPLRGPADAASARRINAVYRDDAALLVWDGSWWIYVPLFFVPDLSFVAYLSGPRLGAFVYNAAHSYIAPMAIMTGGFATAAPLVLSIAMIWLAHIGFDRALGYGLKYASGFGFTHLGRIGKLPI